MIDENVTIINPHMEANEKLWPLDHIAFFNQKSNFFSEVTLMKIWLKKRLPIVESYLQSIQLKSN